MTQETYENVLPVIKSHQDRLCGIWAESVAQLDMPVDLPVIAGEGVPVTNVKGLAMVETKGVSAFARWPEWTYAEHRALGQPALSSFLKVYGREMLMLLNHCPKRVSLGLSEKRVNCTICKTPTMVCGSENAAMTDRKGYRFPLSRTVFPDGCEIQALGALPTDLRACDADRRELEAGMLLHFTTETMQEQVKLTCDFAALLRGEGIAPSAEQTTSGHWVRGVE